MAKGLALYTLMELPKINFRTLDRVANWSKVRLLPMFTRRASSDGFPEAVLSAAAK